MSATVRLVDSEAEWRRVAPRIRDAEHLAFDLEADGFHRYPERTALMQLALPDGTIYLLDPLALEDLSTFGAALADPARTLVLHSGSYDVRALDRDFDFHVRGLLDTALAAQFCGLRRLGLGNVLQERLGIDLPKPKRLQRFDWSRRPLPEDALDYAADDVRHLLPLAHDLLAELERRDRLSWLEEECERLSAVRYESPMPPEEAFMKLKGARDLESAGRAVLRELFLLREQEALRARRPPHFVLGNRAMLELSAQPHTDPAQVRGVGGMLQRGGGQARLRAALRRGREAEPVPWPRARGRNPWTPEARQRLSTLKAWRRSAAEPLDLDPGVVWPAAHLERLALDPAAELAALDQGDPPWVRRWQWLTFGDALDEARQGL